jgi:outer membrane protein TolC
MKSCSSLAFVAGLLSTLLAAGPAVAQVEANQQPAQSPSPAPASSSRSPAAEFEAAIAGVIARPGGLTADRVATRAMRTSFDVRARHEELNAAAAAVDQALVQYIPRITVSARYARLSPLNPPSLGSLVVAAPGTPNGPIAPDTPLFNAPFTVPFPLNSATFQASLTVPLSDYLLRISQQHAAATHSRRAAELNERASRAHAAFDARIAWWNLVRARLGAVIADQGVLQAREHEEDVRRLVNAGAASMADVVRVQSQVANAELLALRAHDLAEVVEDQVRTAMHLDGGVIEIGDDVRVDVSPDANEEFAALYDQAMANRPEIQALTESIGSLREQVTVARAVAFPRLDAFADLISANPNPRVFPQNPVFTTTWDVGVSLSWSPNDVANGVFAARQTDARVATLEAQRSQIRDQLRAEVRGAFTALREARGAIRTTEAGLAAAEESYRVRRVLFHNGRATSVELTDAETDLTRARLESLNARVDLRTAIARLDHATGRDVQRLR